jgi:hypothetical protein
MCTNCKLKIEKISMKKNALDKKKVIAAIKKHKGNFTYIAKSLKIPVLRARSLSRHEDYEKYFKPFEPKPGHPKNIKTKRFDEIPKKKIFEAIFANMGICSLVAEKLGFSYATMYNYKNKDPEIAAAFKLAIEQNLDMAEDSLLTNVKARDNVATLFYLKCKGKDRDYIETVRNINITSDEFEKMKEDELRDKIDITERSITAAENRIIETED